MLEACRLSLVVTSRNDDFGGQMLKRLRLFVQNAVALSDRHRLPAEIIVVEWNPPEGPRLHDVLGLSIKSSYCALRFIEVPPELHRALPNSDRLSLFQMVAKNVGIRRARGEFVCATNQDILFSDELFEKLASQPLSHGAMYRIDRTDVEAEVPETASLDDQLEWCRRHILRVHRRPGTVEGAPLLDWDWLRSDGLSFFSQWARRIAWSLRHEPVALACSAWSIFRSKDFHPLRRLRSLAELAFRVLAKAARPEPKLHTNACGDFTLLAREQWEALRGYPEIPLYSLHIDSFFCYVAAAAGLREQTFRPPCRIYHLEHGSSWAVLGPVERIEWFVRQPWLEYGLLDDLWRHMRSQRRPYLYNDEGWGFAKEDLPEVVLHDGERRAVRPSSSAAAMGESA